ncbi:LLM class flavin-dependent oxidoreductase [Belnapia sp. T6]|uniref:LLM class flavin-dependent oxidoreductase n=1 Tax=Belnapia mucosa TaxID=2804532 RepID=A0ABS1V2W4_9PROT|nr:LLM class flavin-dependent oxidoreductase [Belnapia mucosa]MBL6456029.1 LLM class flavin-dependent oxidoreductase [Belnapia mucosa]
MSGRMILGLSVGGDPAAGGFDFDRYAAAARLAEAAAFDFLLLPDQAAAQPAIRPEPLALLAALSVLTRQVGLVATASTASSHPFNLTRSLASLDHMSGGRAGVALVPGASTAEARSFGLDPADTGLQERAEEFVAVMQGLQDSWDDDAFPRNKATGQFWLRERMHYLKHEGRHFKVRGPLDVARPPQGHVPIFAAADSEAALDFAARCAEVILGGAADLENARAQGAALTARLADHGRAPQAVKRLTRLVACIGRSRQEAEDQAGAMPPPGLVGTPADLADAMESWRDAGVADGFLLQPGGGLEEFLGLAMPELQRRGLVQGERGMSTLRQRLGLPSAASRFA